jgi:hypothetical protein
MHLVQGILALVCCVSLLALIYPFRPFRTRKRAAVVFVATFVAGTGVAMGLRDPAPAGSSKTIALTTNIADNPAPAIDDRHPSNRCPEGAKRTQQEYRVRGTEVDIRKGPGAQHDRIVNEKATKSTGRTYYLQIDSSIRVFEECRVADWSLIRVVEPEWLRDSHRGWVEAKALVSVEGFDAVGYKEEDIFFDKFTAPYKKPIVQAVNKLRREDSRCKDGLDPGSVTLSPSKSKPGKPVFFVACGKGMNVANVYFTEEDLASGKTFVAPVHIKRTQAIQLCEQYAKSAATNPSTVDFSWILDIATSEHANGRTTVWSSFTAKNAFGVAGKFGIRCLLDASGLIEAHISEMR